VETVTNRNGITQSLKQSREKGGLRGRYKSNLSRSSTNSFWKQEGGEGFYCVHGGNQGKG